MKLFFLVAAEDTATIDTLLGGKTRKFFAAGEHREVAIDRARYYAVTDEQLDDTPETLRNVSVDDVRWFVEEAGPRHLQRHKLPDNIATIRPRDESGSRIRIPLPGRLQETRRELRDGARSASRRPRSHAAKMSVTSSVLGQITMSKQPEAGLVILDPRDPLKTAEEWLRRKVMLEGAEEGIWCFHFIGAPSIATSARTFRRSRRFG